MQILHDQFSADVSGHLDDPGRKQLYDLMQADPGARRIYWEHCQMHAMLAWDGGRIGRADAAVTPAGETPFVLPRTLVLHHGGISAQVPEPARGFTVEVPSATIVDLTIGTKLNQ